MVLKLHNCNAWQRSRWKRKEDRGAWEQSCLTFPTELSILEASRVTLHLIGLEYDFKNDWRGFYFCSWFAQCVLSAFQTAHRPDSHVCSASLPYAKKWWPETKEVHEHQLDVRGKALAYTRPLLTQYSVFTMWLMGKDSKSQTEVKDVMQCDLNLCLNSRQTVNLVVCEVAINPFTLTPSGDIAC